MSTLLVTLPLSITLQSLYMKHEMLDIDVNLEYFNGPLRLPVCMQFPAMVWMNNKSKDIEITQLDVAATKNGAA